LHRLVSGVSGIQVRENEDRRAASQRAFRCFGGGDLGDGGGVLQRSI